MFPDLISFEALGGRSFQLVDMASPTLIRCWEVLKSDYGEYKYVLGGLDVRDVGSDTLKRLEIWPTLAPEIQKEIIDGLTTKTQAVHSLMEKARSGRRVKYVGVPRELTCSKCGRKVAIQPSVLVKKVEKIAAIKGITYLMDDFLKSYECNVCNPVKRGKKPNPEFANLPKTLTCKCGKTVAANVYQLKKKAEKNNTTIQKLIEGFVCQICCKTIGKGATGRRALTSEEKSDKVNAKAAYKEEKKLARAERKAEKAKQKALKDSMPRRGRGRPRKNLTSTE
jgi:hypothetical protein